jgi:hypothetical protein
MSQLPLFAPETKEVERPPPNVDYIRKNLLRLLRTAQRAEVMPWSAGEAKSWEERFPELTALLGPEEGAAMLAAFRAELERLRKAA